MTDDKIYMIKGLNDNLDNIIPYENLPQIIIKVKNMQNNIKELTLLLLYLTSWEEKGYGYDDNGRLDEVKIKRSWKGYPFEILDELENDGYIHQSKKSKSVTISENGEEIAKKLIEKYLK